MNVTIILMKDDNEMSKICDIIQSYPESTEFCGCWGEIKFNRQQCIEAITGAVNHFVSLGEKDMIVFACSNNDIGDIEPLLKMQNCCVLKTSAEEFVKSAK